jgi:hypothetical protein
MIYRFGAYPEVIRLVRFYVFVANILEAILEEWWPASKPFFGAICYW